jgi:small subunit ribosomal protein S14
MAKTSSIQKNINRTRLAKKLQAKRQRLKSLIMDKSVTMEERFEAQLKLNELPRNSSKVRIRNRCGLTGRPRAFFRKFKLSRIALRDLASIGQLPGVIKSSW